MLISRKHKAIVLRLRDPSRVTSIIPKSRVFEHDGKEFVAVRHGVEEVKVLRNIGIEAPSPILYYYDWPGRFKPFNHQRHIASFLTLNHRAFNLADLGTGKTVATLWAYDYLRSRGLVNKVLVITPLSTLERTWADEVFQHFPHLTTAVLHGSREKRLKMLATDVDIYLINHDGIKVSGLVDALNLRPDIDLVIVDEVSQVARTAGTDRYKALQKIVNKGAFPRKCWGLTGTPIPNGPMDAWAQCRLLVPERVPPYANRFKDMVMKQITPFLWVPRPIALEVVHEAMQPALRYHRDECIDLPPCVYETRTVEMSSTAKRAYKDMLTKLKVEIEGGEVTAVNEAVKAQKLIQIACGVVYDGDGHQLEVDVMPRLQVVKETIEESSTKVIVFVPFVSAVQLVADYLRKFFTVECIYGAVSKSERDRIFTAFQRAEAPRVIVAQPAAMSHGLTLTAASTIIWFAPTSSNETFEQANARITRPGQKYSQLIMMIEGTDIERKYYARLKDKQKVQGTLLELVKGDREAIAT